MAPEVSSPCTNRSAAGTYHQTQEPTQHPQNTFLHTYIIYTTPQPCRGNSGPHSLSFVSLIPDFSYSMHATRPDHPVLFIKSLFRLHWQKILALNVT